MTLQIELKPARIARVWSSPTAGTLKIAYIDHLGREKTATLPLSIVQAFGEVATPKEVFDELKGEGV